MISLTILAYSGFLVAWGTGQALAEIIQENGKYFSLLFFCVVFITLFGIAVPLLLSKQYSFKLHIPGTKWRQITGNTALLIVFIIGVFNPDAFPVLLKNPPAAAATVKYFLLFLPMSLGIYLQSFFLIPRTIESVVSGKKLSIVLAIIVSALSYGLGFWVDTLFMSIEFAFTMAFLGIFFGMGSVFTGSIYSTFPVLFVVTLVNTLAEAKYYEDPWGILTIGFGVSCAVLVYILFLKGYKKYLFV
jgi:hypothetical protein